MDSAGFNICGPLGNDKFGAFLSFIFYTSLNLPTNS